MKNHQKFMEIAFQQALLAKGKTYPNPAVGCVIVQNQQIIGKGYTQPVGQSHAEIMAIQSCSQSVRGSLLYVTLEPCSHHGKTPPCVDFIIQQKISHVFIGTQDPFPKVKGQGIEKLKRAQIKVTIGIMDEKIKTFYQDYFHFIKTSLPLIILKIAESKDGFINADRNTQTQITGEQCKLWTHHLRNRIDAILVGGQTFRIDEPSLTPYLLKDIPQSKTDTLIWTKTPKSFSFNHPSLTTTPERDIIFLSRKKMKLPPHLKQVVLKESSIDTLFEVIKQQPYHSVLIEGGASVLQQWIMTPYWDIFYILTSNQLLKKGLSWKQDLPQSFFNFSSNDYTQTIIEKFKQDHITLIKKDS